MVNTVSEESTVFLKNFNKNTSSPKGKPNPFRPIISVFLTLFVVGMLLISGPASAFVVSSFDVDNENPYTNEETNFTIKITKISDEVINTTELKITGPNGNVSNATQVSCNPDYVGGLGYGYSGNTFGYGYVFGYGTLLATLGYGYGYGYSNTPTSAITCTFSFTPTVAGAHSGQVLVNGVAVGSNSSLFSAQAPIEENTQYQLTANSTITFTDLPAGNYSVEATELTDGPNPPGGFLVAGKFFDITSNLPNGSFSAVLTFSYPDADNDGIVDGSSPDILETTIKIYFWNGSAWVEAGDVTINTANNTISVVVNHFTFFARIAPRPQAPSGGGTGGGQLTGGGGGAAAITPTTTTTPTTPTPTPTPATAPTTTPTTTPTVLPPAVTTTTPTGFFGLDPFTGNLVMGVLVILGLLSFAHYRKTKMVN